MRPPWEDAPKHRKTIQHFNEPGDAHFLTFSCYHRMALLSKDRSRGWLADAIQAARQKHSLDLWAWVFMPEHAHLLIWPRQSPYAVEKILADLKRPVGQQASRWLKANEPQFLDRLTTRRGNRDYCHFWQVGPGQDHNVFEVATAHQIVEYIHQNPVRRGLVRRAEDWAWSSAAQWGGAEDVVLKIDRTLPPLMDP